MEGKNNLVVTKISNEIDKVIEKFNNEDLLVINRSNDASFFDVFADSMFNYQKGVILVERFFKKDKCKKKGTTHKSYKEEDRKLLSEFKKFAQDIPSASSLSDEEVASINNKVNKYRDEISNIEPKVTVLKTYAYGDFKLIEFNLIDKVYKKNLAILYSEFAYLILSTSTWSPLADTDFIVRTVEYDDYIDLVVFPIK